MTKNMMDPPAQPLYEKKHPNDAPAKTKISTNLEETKKILADLSKGKDQKYVVNKGIADVMKEMWEKKKARNLWKKV